PGLDEPGDRPARAAERAGARRMTTVKELRVALTVENYAEALAFYRGALGMTVLEAWEEPEANISILDAGRATLELIDEGQARLIDEIEVGRRVAGTVRLALEVTDSPATAA